MMKTILTTAVILLGLFILPSCKKNYICICTEGTGNAAGSKEYDLGSQTKRDAEADCDNKVYEYSKGNVVVCKLKY
jgi:hypothetical protein